MNNSSNWYQALKKPSWAPPSYLFGPVWTVLYILIAISFGNVFIAFYQKKIPFITILPFILNLFFNFIFTYLQFKLKSNILAMVDILLVLVTLTWAMLAIYPEMKWVTLMNIPYLLWISFATVLQITVTVLNR